MKRPHILGTEIKSFASKFAFTLAFQAVINDPSMPFRSSKRSNCHSELQITQQLKNESLQNEIYSGNHSLVDGSGIYH